MLVLVALRPARSVVVVVVIVVVVVVAILGAGAGTARAGAGSAGSAGSAVLVLVVFWCWCYCRRCCWRCCCWTTDVQLLHASRPLLVASVGRWAGWHGCGDWRLHLLSAVHQPCAHDRCVIGCACACACSFVLRVHFCRRVCVLLRLHERLPTTTITAAATATTTTAATAAPPPPRP